MPFRKFFAPRPVVSVKRHRDVLCKTAAGSPPSGRPQPRRKPRSAFPAGILFRLQHQRGGIALISHRFWQRRAVSVTPQIPRPPRPPPVECPTIIAFLQVESLKTIAPDRRRTCSYRLPSHVLVRSARCPRRSWPPIHPIASAARSTAFWPVPVVAA